MIQTLRNGRLICWMPEEHKKDLLAAYLLDRALESGELKPGMTVVEISGANMAEAIARQSIKRGFQMIVYTSASRAPRLPAEVTVYEMQPALRINGKTLPQSYLPIAKNFSRENNCYFVNQLENPRHIEFYTEVANRLIESGELNKPDAYIDYIGTGATVKAFASVFGLSDVLVTNLVIPKDNPYLAGMNLNALKSIKVTGGFKEELAELGITNSLDVNKIALAEKWLAENPGKKIFTTIAQTT